MVGVAEAAGEPSDLPRLFTAKLFTSANEVEINFGSAIRTSNSKWEFTSKYCSS